MHAALVVGDIGSLIRIPKHMLHPLAIMFRVGGDHVLPKLEAVLVFIDGLLWVVCSII